MLVNGLLISTPDDSLTDFSSPTSVKFFPGKFNALWGVVYKIPYRRARAWPSVQPLGRVRARAKESCIQYGVDNDTSWTANKSYRKYVLYHRVSVCSGRIILNKNIVSKSPS